MLRTRVRNSFKFLIFSILAALFSASYLGLTKYMLDVLFLQDIDKVVPAPGEFSFSTGYLKAWLEYNFAEIVRNEGPVKTLMYVCFVDCRVRISFEHFPIHGKNGSLKVES